MKKKPFHVKYITSGYKHTGDILKGFVNMGVGVNLWVVSNDGTEFINLHHLIELKKKMDLIADANVHTERTKFHDKRNASLLVKYANPRSIT